MSLETGLRAAFARIASEVKSLWAALDGKANQRYTVKGTNYPAYTFTAADAGCVMITGSSAGMTTLTVPIDTFSEGDHITVVALGGPATIVTDSTDFLIDPAGPLVVPQSKAVTILFLSWMQASVIGGLE